MFDEFKKYSPKVLTLNHYELHELIPKYTVDEWRKFLYDPAIQDFIQAEFAIIQESEMRKVIANASEKDTSVGKAQLINAMLNAKDKVGNKKDGNIIVYSYVLPNKEQAKATNTEVLTRDPLQED